MLGQSVGFTRLVDFSLVSVCLASPQPEKMAIDKTQVKKIVRLNGMIENILKIIVTLLSKVNY